MKEKIEILKKLWQIPRYKAIIQLLLWFIFFFVLFFIYYIFSLFKEEVNVYNKQDDEVKKSVIESYIEMENYEYEYKISYILNNETFEKNISGTKYNDKNTFKILSDKYSIINDQIYDSNNQIVSNLLDYDLINLEPKNIYNMINECSDKEEIKYSDGKIKTEYIGIDYSIIVIEEESLIKEIEIDVTKLINNPKITYYDVKIIYENINNIDSYN